MSGPTSGILALTASDSGTPSRDIPALFQRSLREPDLPHAGSQHTGRHFRATA